MVSKDEKETINTDLYDRRKKQNTTCGFSKEQYFNGAIFIVHFDMLQCTLHNMFVFTNFSFLVSLTQSRIY